jgi:hypothetical protein
MQDAQKIQNQMAGMIQHQENKGVAASDQLTFISGNKRKAEEELAKFQVLREGLKTATAFLTQQREAVAAQEAPNEITLIGFEGALLHLKGLMEQTGTAIAKNEGSFVAFSTMETQLQQTVSQSAARAKGLEVQGAKAVQIAAQGEASVADLISSVDEEPAPAPIASAKKKTSSNSKKGKGRKTKR